MDILATFPRSTEFEKAIAAAHEANIPYTVISPAPGYTSVGTPSLVINEDDKGRLVGGGASRFVASGWVDYHVSSIQVPQSDPPVYEEDKFGKAFIMVLQPCAADIKKLRVIAHISGNLTEVFPYMNAIEKQAFYNAHAQTFTIMIGHRIISLYPHRIAMAKTDDIVDTWRTLESLRVRFNECWKNRATITPSNVLRKRPPAIEIYYRLPKINCGECGEQTCMAFALNLWSGHSSIKRCKPVFGGTHAHLKDALVEICSGLGVEQE